MLLAKSIFRFGTNFAKISKLRCPLAKSWRNKKIIFNFSGEMEDPKIQQQRNQDDDIEVPTRKDCVTFRRRKWQRIQQERDQENEEGYQETDGKGGKRSR